MRASFAIALASILASAASAHAQATVHPPMPDHVLPIRYVERPLTLPEGAFRLDQSVVFDAERSQDVLNAPNALLVGLTDWLEIGVTYTFLRDPGALATLRIAHSSVIDAGIRVQTTVPALTHGDTDLTISFPIVLRLAHWFRIQTAAIGEFLLAQRMEPILRFPLQLAVQMNRRMFFGIQGSVSLVDRRFWHGDLGFVFGHTVAATPIRPIGEVRVGGNFLLGGGGGFAGFEATVSFSFFATALPTPDVGSRRGALE